MSITARLVSLLLSPRCASCDQPIAAGHGFCPRCAMSLYELAASCPRCAEPQEGPRGRECARCRRRPPAFEQVTAPYLYGGELATALCQLKFARRRDIARTLAPLVRSPLAEAAAGADLVIPIPLSRRRLAARTFNQAAALLQYAARGLSLPVDALSLRRLRDTRPQSELTAPRRRANVVRAFAVPHRRRPRVAGRRVLLFDDVMTTGATLDSAARAVLDAGARAVSAFCLARAES